jgi:acyl carrier protein
MTVDVERDVVAIIAQQAKVDPAGLDRTTELSTLDLVSLDMLEIVFDVEEKFDISIAYNANQALSPEHKNFKTVGDVMDFVATHLSSKTPVTQT